MIERQMAAGAAALAVAIFTAALIARRGAALTRAGGRYGGLEQAMLLATAAAVGALAGLIVYVLASGSGR